MKLDHTTSWFYKYAGETFRVSYNFTNALDGDTLASCTASIYDTDNTDKTASMLSSVLVNTASVSFSITGGNSGKTYDLKLAGKSTAGSQTFIAKLVCEVFNTVSLNTKLGDHNNNSYVTLEEANNYIRNKYGHINTWDTMTEEGKKRVLIEAATDMEAFNYQGEKYYDSQGLQFPRDDHAIITGACATPITKTSFRNTALYSTSYNVYPTNYWTNGAVHITAGSALNDTRRISLSNAVNGSITVASDFSATPSTSDTFVVFTPLYKEVRDAQIEQALFLVQNAGISDIQNYKEMGARAVKIGDVAIEFKTWSSGTSGPAIAAKTRALLSRFIRKGLRVQRG
jgi:hypothetical protein